MHFLFALLFLLPSYFQTESRSVPQTDREQIRQQIETLRLAHLQSDTVLAKQVYHDQLLLVSQSGKKYGKADALANITNPFEIYEYTELTFLPIAKKVVITNYVNERKFVGYPKGIYRLTAVWKKEKGKWMMMSMQSSKMKQ